MRGVTCWTAEGRGLCFSPGRVGRSQAVLGTTFNTRDKERTLCSGLGLLYLSGRSVVDSICRRVLDLVRGLVCERSSSAPVPVAGGGPIWGRIERGRRLRGALGLLLRALLLGALLGTGRVLALSDAQIDIKPVRRIAISAGRRNSSGSGHRGGWCRAFRLRFRLLLDPASPQLSVSNRAAHTPDDPKATQKAGPTSSLPQPGLCPP